MEQTENINIGVIEAFLQSLPEKLLNLGIRTVLAILLFLIGVQLIRLIRKIIKKSLKKAAVEIGSIQFLDSCIKTVLYIVLILMIGAWFGIDAASVVAVLGSLGLTIGLAMQGSLANFAGGVLLLTTKPFKVGDYILEDTNKNEGFVTSIELFYTRLRTVDNKIIIIPNGTLANSSLTNLTFMEERMLDLRIGISYQADIAKAKQLIKDILMNEDAIHKDKETQIFVADFLDSAVQIGFRGFVATKDYWTTRWDVLEKVKESFDQNGIEIPYQQVDIHVIDNLTQK
ncbi:MAG TPA: mechanosensitive ion channel domain-containing protein [Lachnospiraceae bacterium]|jgi:small conductance mechanosensitive channel|nr:mechanosensitive ion channel domain-containing protein [Lachnospiraceae bacterium]